MLCEKDSTELANLDELRALAQKELQDWYAHYDDQLKHTKDSNRSAVPSQYGHHSYILILLLSLNHSLSLSRSIHPSLPLLISLSHSLDKQRRHLLRREMKTYQVMSGSVLPACATSTPRITRTRKTSHA